MVSPVASSSGLVRQLGPTSATALVISNMVGTGILTSTGYLAAQLGTPELIFGIWIVGAVFALIGSFCYSELGINFPSSGGEYVYLTEAYGPTWGFMTGWTSFFAGFSGPIALAALALANYLGSIYPAFSADRAWFSIGSGTWVVKLGPAQALAAAVIAALTAVNCVGMRAVARIQNFLTGAKVLVLAAFVLLGFLAGTGSFDHFRQEAVRTSPLSIPAQFAVSLFWIYLAYSGWNAATYVAEEIRNPARTLPLALSVGTLVVTVLFLALNAVFFYGVAPEQMKDVNAIGSLAASNLFGQGMAGVFSVLMAASLLATINAMVIIGPRVYYAMAKNGAFLAMAARVDRRRHTPVVATLCQGGCAVLMAMTPFPSLVLYIAFALNFFAVMSVASLFIFRRRPDWQRLRVVSFAWPLLPATFTVVGTWMTVYGLTLEPRVSLAAAITIALGAAVYQAKLRKPALAR